MTCCSSPPASCPPAPCWRLTEQLARLLLDRAQRVVTDLAVRDRAGGRLDALPRRLERAAERAERAAHDRADRGGDDVEQEQDRDAPGHDAVQQAVDAARHAGKVAGDPAADEQREQGDDGVVDAGGDAEGRGARRVAGGRVDRAEADADAEQAEQQLQAERDRRAGERGSPGHPPESGWGRCGLGDRGSAVVGRGMFGYHGGAPFARPDVWPGLGHCRFCGRKPSSLATALCASMRSSRSARATRRHPEARKGDSLGANARHGGRFLGSRPRKSEPQG